MKFDTTGQLVYSYKVGGSGSVLPAAIAVDTAGEAYVSGSAQEVDFPVANAFQSTYGGGASDGFLLKLDARGSTLLFSTYLGGTGFVAAHAMALDSAGNVVVVGDTSSANFPLSGTPIPTFGSAFGQRLAQFSVHLSLGKRCRFGVFGDGGCVWQLRFGNRLCRSDRLLQSRDRRYRSE
jgi:hypothetical protein